MKRLRLCVHGAVQGVGFRPFVYRLAKELQLAGWVRNGAQGVTIEVEGVRIEEFRERLVRERPPRSAIQSLEGIELDAAGHADFEILESEGGRKTAIVLPDMATCAECLAEIFDPGDRRYRYPFTNCTHCGPRYSIILSLPYDRASTTMSRFTMCDLCRAEYEDPASRRFHAQPNACPACGPKLVLWGSAGKMLAERVEALAAARTALQDGRIVAMKGVGGFLLLADARNQGTVAELRRRKRRGAKPFAIMARSLDQARELCSVSPAEARLLTSPECPIVLLDRRVDLAVAPGNPLLGIMLPSSPLHHLIVDGPLVATSGNLSEEPLATDEHEALSRLAGIADLFLVHDRPIARPVDDSVARIMAGREMILRRARGYAPLPLTLSEAAPPILAVGGHLKSTVAIAVDRHLFVSPHVGDLDNAQTLDAFEATVDALGRLYDFRPEAIACDLHPDYASTAYARKSGVPVFAVQHHEAHIRAAMLENEIEVPALGIAWDGTGYGHDGTLWGGEFLRMRDGGCERVATFRPFPLPGGAIRDLRRTAAGLLFEVRGTADDSLVGDMLRKGIRSPRTSGVGRLFDAVAAITGVCDRATFEGQAAMALEFAIGEGDGCYELPLRDGILDTAPLVEAILRDLHLPVSQISLRFHNALVEAIVRVAHHAEEPRVVLSGGCFQNRYLLERTVARLSEEGFQPYWPQRIPPNDGGISVGQAAAAIALLAKKR